MSGSDRDDNSRDLGGFGIIVLFILSSILVGFLAFSSGQESERNTQSAGNYRDYAQGRENLYCRGLEGASFTQCKIEQIEAAQEKYNAQQDLNAQKNMALWAGAMFFVSLLTAVLTLWALIYVRGTLVATREALDDTGKATKAMQVANKIARDTSERQLRAYMHVDDCAIEIEDPNNTFALFISLTNSGQTPAYNLRIMAETFADNYPLEAEREFTDVADSHSMSIGPNGNIGCYKRIWCDDVTETLLEVRAGNVALYIQGVCRYNDAFGKERETFFRWAYTGADSENGMIMKAGSTGNSAT